jgi:hypothetical protein
MPILGLVSTTPHYRQSLLGTQISVGHLQWAPPTTPHYRQSMLGTRFLVGHLQWPPWI